MFSKRGRNRHFYISVFACSLIPPCFDRRKHGTRGWLQGDASAGIQQKFGRRNPNKEKPTGLTVEATDFPSSVLLMSQRDPATSDAIG